MRHLTLRAFGPSGKIIAATVLDTTGSIVATIAQPIALPSLEALRDAVVDTALSEDFGETILAGVAFAPLWGGDAIGFT